MRTSFRLLITAFLALPTAALAQEPVTVAELEPAEHAIIQSDQATYAPLEVPGFDPGIMLAVIHGDPNAETDYTVRIKLPDGYRFPAHYHPKAEHITILDGTFLLARGEKVDEATIQEYEDGDFIYIPAKDPHYGGAKGETVIQLHGQGPFEIILVEAAS